MLTTNDRFIQATDPNTGVARACAPTTNAVTASAYPVSATLPSIPARVWSDLGRKAMTNVDFHERWPLHSTS